MLVVDQLNTEYLQDVTFECDREICAIVGPSGSGKTTLLRCIAGLYPTAQSSIVLTEKLPAIRFIPSSLPDEMKRFTLRELLVLHQCDDPDSWATRFGVAERVDVRADDETLSTGEQRCIGLALGLWNIINGTLILIDELTNGLDNYLIKSVLRVLRDLQQNKVATILCVIHQPSISTLASVDRIVGIAQGKCVLNCLSTQLINYEYTAEEIEAKLINILDVQTEAQHRVSRPVSVSQFRPAPFRHLRVVKLPLFNIFKFHAFLQMRSPVLLLTVFLGLALCILLTITINLHNMYVSNLVYQSANNHALSLDIDYPINDQIHYQKGFSQFDGDVSNDDTARYVEAFSRSFWSSLLYGINAYDRYTGDIDSTMVINPLLQFVAQLEADKAESVAHYMDAIQEVGNCVYQKLSDAFDINDAYRAYKSVSQPSGMDTLIYSHKLMKLLDYITVDRADMWRSVQQDCVLNGSSDSLPFYLCSINHIGPLVNALTDCLNWPRIPFTDSNFVEVVHNSTINTLPSQSVLRRLSSNNALSGDAWEDMQDTLTFSGDTVWSILSRILMPSGSEKTKEAYWSDLLSFTMK